MRVDSFPKATAIGRFQKIKMPEMMRRNTIRIFNQEFMVERMNLNIGYNTIMTIRRIFNGLNEKEYPVR